MNKKILMFHFTAPTKEMIIGFSKSIFNLDAILCFDLEDIVKDLPINLDNEGQRNLHRKDVITTIELLFAQHINPMVGIRMNTWDSIEFYEDLKAIESIKTKIKINCIFLPKVESYLEIERCESILNQKVIDFDEIIPIIESKKGYNNLEDIIKFSKVRINKIAFGHCDYNFALNNFPFYHQNTEKYWEWVNHILLITEQNDICLINSPYLYLKDDAGFLSTLKRINEKVSGTFGQVTLSIDQLRLCSSINLQQAFPTHVFTGNIAEKGKLDFAKMIVTDFEIYKLKNRSFSLDRNKRIVISPQEYLAAREYLKNSIM